MLTEAGWNNEGVSPDGPTAFVFSGGASLGAIFMSVGLAGARRALADARRGALVA